MVLGEIRIGNTNAQLTDSGWQSENETLAALLNQQYGQYEPLAGEYDPNPAQTLLEKVIANEGGEIITPAIVKRYEGVVY